MSEGIVRLCSCSKPLVRKSWESEDRYKMRTYCSNRCQRAAQRKRYWGPPLQRSVVEPDR